MFPIVLLAPQPQKKTNGRGFEYSWLYIKIWTRDFNLSSNNSLMLRNEFVNFNFLIQGLGFIAPVSLTVLSMSLDGAAVMMPAPPSSSSPTVPITPTSQACPVCLDKQIDHFTGTAAVIGKKMGSCSKNTSPRHSSQIGWLSDIFHVHSGDNLPFLPDYWDSWPCLHLWSEII